MITREYKVTVSPDATFEDRWLFAVWERMIEPDGERTKWVCIHQQLARYNAWKQHSRADLRIALRSLL